MIPAAFAEIAKIALEKTSKELPNFANKLKPESIRSFTEADKPFRKSRDFDKKIGLEENKVYKNESLKDTEINGRECKINENFDVKEKVGLNGETNLELMEQGKSPINKNGEKIELHHIGQDPNGGFAELPTTAHRGAENYKTLHKNFDESKIDRNRFNTEKSNHWKERARIIKEGVLNV